MPFGWVGCDARRAQLSTRDCRDNRLQCLSAGLAVMPLLLTEKLNEMARGLQCLSAGLAVMPVARRVRG